MKVYLVTDLEGSVACGTGTTASGHQRSAGTVAPHRRGERRG